MHYLGFVPRLHSWFIRYNTFEKLKKDNRRTFFSKVKHLLVVTLFVNTHRDSLCLSIFPWIGKSFNYVIMRIILDEYFYRIVKFFCIICSEKIQWTRGSISYNTFIQILSLIDEKLFVFFSSWKLLKSRGHKKKSWYWLVKYFTAGKR